MNKDPRWLRPLFAFTLFLLLVAAQPNTLHAQATKIFVASFGNDANDGSRGAPKRNFQPAHNGVAAGGQIVVLDTAGYGALTITKSVAITVPPGVNGFVTVSGNSSAITIAAGPSDTVTLRGLVIEGGGNSSGGTGINIPSFSPTVGGLFIEDCTVRNFGLGIVVASTAALKLNFANCAMRNCGDAIDIQIAAAVKVLVVATGCRLEQNSSNALATQGAAGSSVDVTLSDCTLSGNNAAINVVTAGSVVRVENCRIVGNTNGIVNSGGQVLSRGNNTLENNPTFSTFPGSYSAK